MTTTGDRMAMAWLRTYTRGLPAEIAERRCDELVSDLHEHASEQGRTPAQQREVLGRVLWGIPADLSWRRAARAPRERRLATGAPTMTIRKVSTVLFIIYALFFSWGAIGIIGNGYGVWAMPLLLSSALIAFGLRQRDDAPRRSTVLLVIGATLPVPTLFWMAIILGPIALAMSWLAIASEPGRGTSTPTPAPAI